jgi:hypothetical protein
MESRRNVRRNKWSCQWPRTCENSKRAFPGTPKDRALAIGPPHNGTPSRILIGVARPVASKAISSPYTLYQRGYRHRNVQRCRHIALLQCCPGCRLRRGSSFWNSTSLQTTLSSPRRQGQGERPMASKCCQSNYTVCRRRSPFLRLGTRSTFKGTEHANMDRAYVIARISIWSRSAIRLLSKFLLFSSSPPLLRISNDICFHVLFRTESNSRSSACIQHHGFSSTSQYVEPRLLVNALVHPM